ncbi:uncharacterized protein AB675_11065 [Cyphellophora attinorum]|uniref:Uncharacterized protein n=1 Tax=Cyphellophora attinorum TaxID=1664694 RepID=A0A0N0NH73_9EURO|nr:uncharacterized protein AB675_11065 [Phialophora attinorum]KPI34351.1 hypothetical protein AB675_11065 [Phialophora attinorum]
MPIQWNTELERQLLLWIISEGNLTPNTDVLQKVADRFGPGVVTAKALSQKFYKLKKEAEKLLADGAGPDTPATPVAKGTKTPASKSTAGKRKKATDTNGDAEADDAAAATPTKTPKKRKTNAKDAKVKTEETEPEVAAEGEASEEVKAEDGENGDGEVAADAVTEEAAEGVNGEEGEKVAEKA